MKHCIHFSTNICVYCTNLSSTRSIAIKMTIYCTLASICLGSEQYLYYPVPNTDEYCTVPQYHLTRIATSIKSINVVLLSRNRNLVVWYCWCCDSRRATSVSAEVSQWRVWTVQRSHVSAVQVWTRDQGDAVR